MDVIRLPSATENLEDSKTHLEPKICAITDTWYLCTSTRKYIESGKTILKVLKNIL